MRNVSKLEPYRKPRRPRTTSPITHIKVDLRVWRTALKLAGGDATRLVVESATSVVVTNFSRRAS